MDEDSRKQKIMEELFDKHFGTVKERTMKNIEENSYSKPIFNIPIKAEMLKIASLVQTSRIRYGDFFEDLINTILKENNFILHNDKNKKETKNYDLFFSKNNDKLTYYIGEIKMKDWHDSTKKVGQFDNLEKKIKFAKEKIIKDKNYKLIGIMFFIDTKYDKNKKYYKNRFISLKKDNLIEDYQILYWEGLPKFLGIEESWNEWFRIWSDIHKCYLERNEIYEKVFNDTKQKEQ